MSIIIPGYYVTIPNKVWHANFRTQIGDQKRVLSISKYKEASFNQLLTCLGEGVREETDFGEDQDTLDEILAGLGDEGKRDIIINGRGKIVDDLKEEYLEKTRGISPRKIIRSAFGILPRRTIKSAGRSGGNDREFWENLLYEALTKGNNSVLELGIAVLEGNILPSQERLDIHIEDRSFNSRVHYIGSSDYSPRVVKGLVQLLKSVFQNPTNITLLEDESNRWLVSDAVDLISEVYFGRGYCDSGDESDEPGEDEDPYDLHSSLATTTTLPRDPMEMGLIQDRWDLIRGRKKGKDQNPDERGCGEN